MNHFINLTLIRHRLEPKLPRPVEAMSEAELKLKQQEKQQFRHDLKLAILYTLLLLHVMGILGIISYKISMLIK